MNEDAPLTITPDAPLTVPDTMQVPDGLPLGPHAPSPAGPGAPAAAPDPLAALRDIHMPDPVSVWPLAPGWWILAGLMLVALSVLLVWCLRRYQRNRYRRLALAELHRLEHQDLTPKALLNEIAQLIQRTLRHSNQTTTTFENVVNQYMSPEYASLLIQGRYQPSPDIKTYGLIVATRNWIKQHRLTKGRSC